MLDIDHQEPTGRPHFRATIEHIHPAGTVVKVELTMGSGEVVNVEMPHERYRSLRLRKGMSVFVSIKDMKVFGQAKSSMQGGGI